MLRLLTIIIRFEPGETNLKNVGYGILKQLYRDLELDKFWNWKSKGRQFLYYDEILGACEKAFGIELNNKYRSRQQVRRMLRY